MADNDHRCLVLEHWEYGRRIASQKLRAWGMYMPEDELRSLVGLALCEAASRYEPKRGAKFQTFAYYHLLGALTDSIERSRRQQEVNCELDLIEAESAQIEASDEGAASSPETLLLHLEAKEKINQASAGLNAMQRQIIQKYFIEDEPVRHIAEELNCCHSHVSRLKNKAVTSMRKAFSGKRELRQL
ncbi:MAG: sigma-70 family RNA polymerase sigma factor [Bdellovibrionales bacterium]|nr:sigma-70 family RNA polymerase sigma factor [Bdellovibrionales bacterium]